MKEKILGSLSVARDIVFPKSVFKKRNFGKFKLKKGCLFYIHMGKTGGGSLNRWFHSVIRDQFCFEGQFDGIERLTGMASVGAAVAALSTLRKRQRQSLRLAMGHLPLGLMHYVPQPVYCLTVLRDPVERELSSYSYLQTVGHTRGNHFQKLTIGEYTATKTVADNYQVRILTGLDALNPIWNSKAVCTPIHERMDLLALAQHNLKKYFVAVGLLETLDEFAVQLANFIGYKKPIVLGRENKTLARITKDSLTDEDLYLLKQKVDLDLKLYEWVKTFYHKEQHDKLYDS